MKAIGIFLSLFCLALIPTLDAKPVPKDKTPEDAKSILGTWIVVSLKRGEGREAPKEEIDKLQMVITAEQLIGVTKNDNGNREEPANYKIDPSKNPKEIDITPVRKGEAVPGVPQPTLLGIYELSGDDLKIRMDDKDRPKSFTEDSEKAKLIVLKREKK